MANRVQSCKIQRGCEDHAVWSTLHICTIPILNAKWTVCITLLTWGRSSFFFFFFFARMLAPDLNIFMTFYRQQSCMPSYPLTKNDPKIMIKLSELMVTSLTHRSAINALSSFLSRQKIKNYFFADKLRVWWLSRVPTTRNLFQGYI